MIKKFIAELIGTFIFLSIILSAIAKPDNTTPIKIIIGLLASIYLLGHISGGHFNPAVSFMMLIDESQSFNTVDFSYYTIAQLIGAAFAVYFYKYINK